MAAFDTPWLDSMSSPTASNSNDDRSATDPNPPTIASFSPVTLSHATSANKQRSTILVHQKSPLLIATPPQITRALAYSHPFLLPLNQIAGLLTWTSGDPWESFLLLAAFWAAVLYGDVLMRYFGPVVVVIGLILGMYSRRYSPLSSTGWTGEKQKPGHKREDSEATTLKHQKTLDEIVETLKVFTSRCNLLLDPLLILTDFLSTQRTATTATTRPALTTLLIRILLVTPLWIVLTLPPVYVVTTKRIALVTGTIFLTWHSRPARVSRTILWRSASIRRFCAIVTGLTYPTPTKTTMSDAQKKQTDSLSPASKNMQAYQGANLAAVEASKRRPDAPGVRFTFILYENQRRWVGLGWTTSLLAYERDPWTDEHLNTASPRDVFALPDVEGAQARWRWVEGSKWLVEGAGELDEGGSKAKESTTDGGKGWIYYDNKWQNGRRGIDGWGRYTRRRKWYRDAELVEITPSTEVTPSPTPTHQSTRPEAPPRYTEKEDDGMSIHSKSSSTRSSFRPGGLRRAMTNSMDAPSEDEGLPGHKPIREREAEWGIGDDARMGLE